MPTCVDAIQDSLTRLHRFEPDTTGWVARHRQAFQPMTESARIPVAAFESAVVAAIKAAALYADAHAARYDSPIGDDGVLGPHFAAWLAAIRGLLNGETGRLDCGTLDGLLLEIGRRAGVVDENGEIRG